MCVCVCVCACVCMCVGELVRVLCVRVSKCVQDKEIFCVYVCVCPSTALEQIELAAELPDYFSWSNQSNINQTVHVLACALLHARMHKHQQASTPKVSQLKSTIELYYYLHAEFRCTCNLQQLSSFINRARIWGRSGSSRRGISTRPCDSGLTRSLGSTGGLGICPCYACCCSDAVQSSICSSRRAAASFL